VFGCAPGSTEATTLEASKNPMRYHQQNDPNYVISIDSYQNCC